MKVSKINEWFEKLGRFQLKHCRAIPDRILHHSHVITIAEIFIHFATSLGNNYIGIEGMNELTPIKFEVMKGG